jgi:2-oxoisovalerate dehydrogenase E1 component
MKPNIDQPVLIKAYSLLCTAKAITDKFDQQSRIVSKYVHATSRGHEAIQIALGMQLTPKDFVAPYYRDDAMLLAIGMRPYDLMLQVLAELTIVTQALGRTINQKYLTNHQLQECRPFLLPE